MNKLVQIAAVGLIVAGCNQGTSGGPGAVPPRTERDTTETDHATTITDRTTEPVVNNADSKERDNAVLGQDDKTFKLDVPNLATSLKQGETKQISIGISRGDNMDQDVKLKFTNLPQGVTVEPATPMIEHGKSEAPVMIVAKADAALGDFTVHVEGDPETGATATNEFKISVSES